jgi:hypothetical protein
MTTQVEEAQDLYAKLKPAAVHASRLYILTRTPAYLQDEMVVLIDADIPPVDPPVVVDLPFVSQTGAGAGSTLNCTLGNWMNTPTARVYQWRVAGIVVGTNSPSYTVVAGDVGKAAVCNMVATNGAGSSPAVASNQIVVA